MNHSSESVLSVRDLKVHFAQKKGIFSHGGSLVRAVDGVSFDVGQGETLGLVGESGCGKSTVGRALAQLIRPTSGTVELFGEDAASFSKADLRSLRRDLQVVFQDPYSSLDPRMRVGAAIREPLAIHGIAKGAAAEERVRKLLDAVGLPAASVSRYPHEFSGGQRQRIAIARALALEPKLIICDEPISALDVSVQAQIINLLVELQASRNLSYLFIAHDLAVVRHISHRIAVMYLGRIVEKGPSEALCDRPLHPYTRALFSAVPRADPRVARQDGKPVIRGEIPSPLNPPPGCHFHTRCPFVQDACRTKAPALETAGPKQQVACHFWKEIASGAQTTSTNHPEHAS